MTTRYKLLNNFPSDVIDFIHSEYHRVIGDDNLEKFINSPDKIKTIQPSLTMIPHRVELPIPELEPIIIFLITPPNSGMGIIHTDKSRHCGLNVPIRVDLKDGPYIALKEEALDNIPAGKSFELDGKIGYTWDYNSEYFEEVQLTAPIFVNTGLPHSWDNRSNDYRILGSLYFKELDTESASIISNQWI